MTSNSGETVAVGATNETNEHRTTEERLDDIERRMDAMYDVLVRVRDAIEYLDVKADMTQSDLCDLEDVLSGPSADDDEEPGEIPAPSPARAVA